MTNKHILIDVPMPIYTPRLVIRPPAPGDGVETFKAKTESFNELSRWMPWAKKDDTLEDTEIILRENFAKFILREDMMLLGFHRENGELVIASGLHRFNWTIRRFEIGYWTRTKYHNNGYATETANALTRFAFNALAAKRVEIMHAEGNEASAAVPKKLGFTYEGRNDFDTALPDGTAVAKHVYARFNTDNLPPLEVTWNI